MTYRMVNNCMWSEMVCLTKFAWKAACSSLLWHEFDPGKTSVVEQEPYDDPEEVQYKTPVTVEGFFDDEPSEEFRKKWGITEIASAVAFLSTLLLDEHGYVVTMRDQIEYAGARYDIVKKDIPVGQGGREAVMVLSLTPSERVPR